jgi:hypothetical protein
MPNNFWRIHFCCSWKYIFFIFISFEALIIIISPCIGFYFNIIGFIDSVGSILGIHINFPLTHISRSIAFIVRNSSCLFKSCRLCIPSVFFLFQHLVSSYIRKEFVCLLFKHVKSRFLIFVKNPVGDSPTRCTFFKWHTLILVSFGQNLQKFVSYINFI